MTHRTRRLSMSDYAFGQSDLRLSTPVAPAVEQDDQSRSRATAPGGGHVRFQGLRRAAACGRARTHRRSGLPGHVPAFDRGPGRVSGRTWRTSTSTGSASGTRSRTGPSKATSASAGSTVRRSTSRTTASTGTSPSAATSPRSSGKATRPARSGASPSASCMQRCASSPTCSRRRASRRATGSASTCRWCRRRWWRCSRARGSARCTPWCSAGSPPTRCATASSTPTAGW